MNSAARSLADGRHIDARDAVWVIDCERKLGAVGV